MKIIDVLQWIGILILSIILGFIGYKILPLWKKYKLWCMISFFILIFFLMFYGFENVEPFVEFLPYPMQQILKMKEKSKYFLQNNQNNINSFSKEDEDDLPKVFHKRKVSNALKKLVASNQKWQCKRCNQLLDETYEVDHIISLHLGGTNEPENLQAFCRNCHGKKTFRESLNGFKIENENE